MKRAAMSFEKGTHDRRHRRHHNLLCAPGYAVLLRCQRRGFRLCLWADGYVAGGDAASRVSTGNSGMLTKELAADIFDRIRRFSSADEVEAIFTGSRFALTRFANNTIHQNVEEENSVVSIRTNCAGRTARATTNQFDDGSLQRAVAASENLARVQAPDPDLLPMPDALEALGRTGGTPVAPSSRFFAPSSRFFEQTAAITPGDRAEVVRGIVSVAGKHKLTTAGIYSNSESEEGIFNCRGVANWHHQTLAEISITMLAGDP